MTDDTKPLRPPPVHWPYILVTASFGLGLAAVPWLLTTEEGRSLFVFPMLLAWLLQVVWTTWIFADAFGVLGQRLPIGPIRTAIFAVVSLCILPIWHSVALLLLSRSVLGVLVRTQPRGQAPTGLLRAASMLQELVWISIVWTVVEAILFSRWSAFLIETYGSEVRRWGDYPDDLQVSWLGPVGAYGLLIFRLLAVGAYVRVLVMATPAIYRGLSLLKAHEAAEEAHRARSLDGEREA